MFHKPRILPKKWGSQVTPGHRHFFSVKMVGVVLHNIRGREQGVWYKNNSLSLRWRECVPIYVQ